ncbi:hypothetical protein, partial [Salmonella enterica]|uniref:hypothetical protein n=1 Tax=Salmonella enterica TaxID=28901 RepID=UPI001F3F840D
AQLTNLHATLFFKLKPGANASETDEFQNNINSYEEKNENSRFTACFGHGDGAGRLPEYGL